MFNTIYINENVAGKYNIVPVLNNSLLLPRTQALVKCGGLHSPLTYYSSTSSAVITPIGKKHTLEVRERTNHSLTIEVDPNRFQRLATAPYVSLQAVDSAWDAAMVLYETREAGEQYIQLNWAYILLESENFYTFKSRAPIGKVVCSLTPQGFIMLANQHAYRFERDAQGIKLDAIKYNGPELSALMFYKNDLGLAVAQVEGRARLYRVGYNLEQVGDFVECCDNSKYYLERTSIDMPVLSSLDANNSLTIFSNMIDLNERVVVNSILPTTHNVSVDAYNNGGISILEYGADYTRRTVINYVGVERTEEVKPLRKIYDTISGTYKRAPGLPFTSVKIYELPERLGNRTTYNPLFIFFSGRVANYIAPHISPQWYLTKVNNELAAAPELVARDAALTTRCTPKQLSEVFAVSLIVGSPIDSKALWCFKNNTGEYGVQYTFGRHITMNFQGIRTSGGMHQAEAYLDMINQNKDGRWLFPEVGYCGSMGCDEAHLVSTLYRLWPNTTKILEHLLRPAACTYEALEELDTSSERQASGIATGVYDSVLGFLGAVNRALGRVIEVNEET